MVLVVVQGVEAHEEGFTVDGRRLPVCANGVDGF